MSCKQTISIYMDIDIFLQTLRHSINKLSCQNNDHRSLITVFLSLLFHELPWTKYLKIGHFSYKFIYSRYLLDETIDDCNNNDEDVMSLEAADVLREWTEIWHQLYIDQDQSKFNQLKVLSSNFLF